jgi:hypothetical protein
MRNSAVRLSAEAGAAPAAEPSNWQLWNRFWFGAVDPATLGLIRVCTGLVILYVHLTYTGSLQKYWGKDAWLDLETVNDLRRDQPVFAQPFEWSEPNHPPAIEPFRDAAEEKAANAFMERWKSDPRLAYSKGKSIFSIWFHVTDPAWMMAIHLGFLAAVALFTVGLFTRVTGVITWMAVLCYIQRSWTTLFGMDTIIVVLALYLMISPCGAVYSLDRWLARRRARQRGVDLPETPALSSAANFALRLMQFHFCVIYMASGISKLQGASWLNFTAVYLVMANYEFNPLHLWLYYEALVWLCQHQWLWEIFITASTVGTLVIELSLPFMIWRPRWRPYYMVASLMLHTGIAAIMGLTTFSMLMVCLLMAFIPAAVTRRGVRTSVDWLLGPAREEGARATAPLARSMSLQSR